MPTPVHQAVGLYEVKSPFSVTPNAAYICESIQGFEALIDKGVNVYETYYSPHSLTQADYERDLKNNENIVTLLSSTEDTVILPSSYILSFPDEKAVPYSRTLLVVDLGALPDGFAMTATQEHVKEVIDHNIGIESVSSLVVGPITNYVDYATHGDREQARRAKIDYEDSPLRQLAIANETIAEQAERIKLLQAQLLKYI
ncbi:hypothetical protein [Vibrio phage vB_VmeM-Yong XC32]|nr:hypothetical protein [Vibrio phage vB_VmeM-Yong XC31]QAX96474.1 hypothetical protein [Vibrio phage vB_VmeM-Yong XC32]QAX96791.1 hypothetical protein [Vibrio phage vB_VmeM-Yong MS31]QAX97110.1 hypothetical protein [Vibrio phage vB_VmeM-Yong MS32]